MTYRYYFAGALFCHKELIGNHLLAEAIRDRSGGEFAANLPQKEEKILCVQAAWPTVPPYPLQDRIG